MSVDKSQFVASYYQKRLQTGSVPSLTIWYSKFSHRKRKFQAPRPVVAFCLLFCETKRRSHSAECETLFAKPYTKLQNKPRRRALNPFLERLQNDTPAGAPHHFCRNEQTRGLYFHAFAHLIQKNCLKPRFLRLFSIFSLRNFPNFFKLFPLNVYFKPFLAFCPMR